MPDTGDVYLVPAFAGLGAPQWDAAARGTIVGLTRGSTRAHIARAALESIAFQTADLIEAMQQDCGQPLSELRVDGGAARNDLLMQFQADLLGVPVLRPANTETTAFGAAALAGLGVGLLAVASRTRIACGSSRSASSRAWRARRPRDAARAGARRWNAHAPGHRHVNAKNQRAPRRDSRDARGRRRRAAGALGSSTTSRTNYLDRHVTERISSALFAAPPAADSPQTRGELDELLAMQRAAHAAEVEAAHADRKTEI